MDSNLPEQGIQQIEVIWFVEPEIQLLLTMPARFKFGFLSSGAKKAFSVFSFSCPYSSGSFSDSVS